MYKEYSLIARFFPGWALSEIKAMSHRERQYWIGQGIWQKGLSGRA